MNFQEAALKVTQLSKKPNDATLLELYALYKQATIGDTSTERPGFFDFVGKAKWDAWNSHKGTTKENAEKGYITLVQSLVE